ncbi:hypothetical protein [Streptomyces sp. CPS1]
MTEIDLNAIQALTTAEHLTPGPWRLDREQCDCEDGYCHHGEYVTGVIAPTPTEGAAARLKRTGEEPRDYDFHRTEIGDFTDADWELMVAAREALPALVAEVRRLRDQVAAAHAQAFGQAADELEGIYARDYPLAGVDHLIRALATRLRTAPVARSAAV